MTNYTVIMGDLKGSRKLNGEERHQAQLFLKATLVQINENYKHLVFAPFMISKGDEIQGVLMEPTPALDIIRTLQRMLYPLTFRFGIGMGVIHVMGGTLPIEMDGPAFHRASASLFKAKKQKVDILIETDFPLFNAMLNEIFILSSALKSRWKEDHHQYYWQYKEMKKIKTIASFRKISPQAVSEQIRKLHIQKLLRTESTITAMLAELKHLYSQKKP